MAEYFYDPFRLPEYLPRRVDPLQKKRGEAPWIAEDDKLLHAIRRELFRASAQQLAALALRYIEIAEVVLLEEAPQQYNLALTIHWQSVIELYTRVKNADSEEEAFRIDSWDILGSPDSTYDLQRDLEAWLPDRTVDYASHLGVAQQIDLIYFQILQLLTRQARYMMEPWSYESFYEVIYLCSLWLALIPSARHEWPVNLQAQFLWPELGVNADEGLDQDLSDVSESVRLNSEIMADSIFGRLWTEGLKSVWREINAAIPFRGLR